MTPRAFLAIVLERCPGYREPLPNCPLAELRGKEIDPAQRKLRLDALTDQDVDENIRRHFLCLCRKNGCGT